MKISKKTIIVSLCILSMLFVSCAKNSDEVAETQELDVESIEQDRDYSEGLEFVSRGDGTAILASIGSCSDSIVIIPPTTPDGDRVTEVGDFAFTDCSDVIRIEVPDSVTTIGHGAFTYCSNLTSIVIPDSVTIIGIDAIIECDNLIEVTLPDDFMVKIGLADNPYESSETAGFVIIAYSNNYVVNTERMINGMSELDWLNSHGYVEYQENVAAVESHNAEIAEVVEQLNQQLNEG